MSEKKQLRTKKQAHISDEMGEPNNICKWQEKEEIHSPLLEIAINLIIYTSPKLFLITKVCRHIALPLQKY